MASKRISKLDRPVIIFQDFRMHACRRWNVPRASRVILEQGRPSDRSSFARSQAVGLMACSRVWAFPKVWVRFCPVCRLCPARGSHVRPWVASKRIPKLGRSVIIIRDFRKHVCRQRSFPRALGLFMVGHPTTFLLVQP